MKLRMMMMVFDIWSGIKNKPTNKQNQNEYKKNQR